MNKFTRQQKRIIAIASGMAACFLFFWVFVYAPQAKRVRAVKEEIARAETQIAEIKAITAGRDLVKAVAELNLNFRQVSAKLSATSKDVVDDISQEAHNRKIELKNINFSELRPLPSRVPGYEIDALPINMALSCEYRALGEYLLALRNSLPVFIVVKQMGIRGKGEGSPLLDVNLSLSAYLSREKK